MSAVTYRESYAPTVDTAAARRKKGLFARILDRMMEARMREATRQIEVHVGYLPEDLRERYARTAKKNVQQELPFGR